MESQDSTQQSFDVTGASPPTLQCSFSESEQRPALSSSTTPACQPSPTTSPLPMSMYTTSSQLCLSSSLSSLLQCFPSPPPPLQPQSPTSPSLAAETRQFLNRPSTDPSAPSMALPTPSAADFAPHSSTTASDISKASSSSSGGAGIENMFTCGICRKQYSTEKYLQMHFALHKDVGAAATTSDFIVDKKTRRQLKPGIHQSDRNARSPFFRHQRHLAMFSDQKEKHPLVKQRQYDCQHFQATNPKLLQELQHTSQHSTSSTDDSSIRLPLSPYLDFNSFPLSANTSSVFQRSPSALLQTDFPASEFSLTYHQSPLPAVAGEPVSFLDSSTSDVFQSVPTNNAQLSSDVKDDCTNQSNQFIAASYYSECAPLPRYFDRYKNIGQTSKIDVSYQQQRQKAAAASSSAAQVWTCTYCSKTFTQSSNYKNHVRTHSDERPYVCELCSIGFKERYHLKKHLLFKHSTEAKEECRFCGKRFKDSTAVRAHERIHSDQRPYSCQRCRKAFKTSECLWHHENRSRTCGKALDNAKNEAIANQNLKTTADNLRNPLNALDKALLPASVSKQSRKSNSGMRKTGENSKKKSHSQKLIGSELRTGLTLKDSHHYANPPPMDRSLVKLERNSCSQNNSGHTPESRFQMFNHRYYSPYFSKMEPFENCFSNVQGFELAGATSFFSDSATPTSSRKSKQIEKTDGEHQSSSAYGDERNELLTYAQLKPVKKSSPALSNLGYDKSREQIIGTNHDQSPIAYYQFNGAAPNLTTLEPISCSAWPKMLIRNSNCKYEAIDSSSNGYSNGRETCQFLKEQSHKKKTYARESDLNGSNCPVKFDSAATRKTEMTCEDISLLASFDPGQSPVPQLYHRDSTFPFRQQSQSIAHCQRQHGYSYYQGSPHLPYMGANHGQHQMAQVNYANHSSNGSSCYLQNHLQNQPNPSYTSFSHEQSLSHSQSSNGYHHQHQTNLFYLPHQHTQPLFNSQSHQHVLLPTAVVAPIKRLDDSMTETDVPLDLVSVPLQASGQTNQTLTLDTDYYDSQSNTSSYQQIMHHASTEAEKITYTQQCHSDDFASKQCLLHDSEKSSTDQNDNLHRENTTPKISDASPVTSCGHLDIKSLPPFETFVPVTRSTPDHIHQQQSLPNSPTTGSLSDDQKSLLSSSSPQEPPTPLQPLIQQQHQLPLQNQHLGQQVNMNNTFQSQHFYNCRYTN